MPMPMNSLLLLSLADPITTALVFGIILLVARLLSEQFRSRSGLPLPPGPRGLPVLGYLPFIERHAHVTLERLAARYGKVFRVSMGNRLFVFIADHKVLRDAFKREVFAARPSLPTVDSVMEGYGVTATNGSFWKEQRRFTQTALRDVGFAKTAQNRSRVEEHSLHNISLMVQEIQRVDGDPFDISVLLGCTLINNFYALVAGTRPFRLFDPELVKRIEKNEDSFKRTEMLGLINFFPWLMWLPPLKRNLSIIYGYKREFQDEARPLVAKHNATLDADNPRDLIDAYLIQQQKHACHGTEGNFTEIQLLHLLGDLYGAGLGTTKTTLCWFFLAMMKYPEIQAQVHEELDCVIGRDRQPCFGDLPHLPYTEAVLMETQRYATILPTGVPHATTQDVELEGYLIPKGTVVSGLFWSFHHNPKFWKNPNGFDPTHFINDDGSVYKPDFFMPFSIGRRICLGEDVARLNMFLVATHILQEFRLQLAPESQHVEMTHSATFLLSPPSYKMVAEKRPLL